MPCLKRPPLADAYSTIRTPVKQAFVQMAQREWEAAPSVSGRTGALLAAARTVIGHLDPAMVTEDADDTLLHSLRQHVSATGSVWAADMALMPFMRAVDGLMKREKAFFYAVAGSKGQDGAAALMREELLCRLVLPKTKDREGFAALLVQGQWEDARLVCGMLEQVGPEALEVLASCLQELVAGEVKALAQPGVPGGAAAAEEAAAVVGVRTVWSERIKQHLMESHVFHKALKAGLEAGLRARPSFPEVLAVALDELLRRGGEEAQLREVTSLVAYVAECDLFAEWARRRLAQRLQAPERRSSDDDERVVLSELKSLCGSALTSSMETMLQDVQTSRDLGEGFACPGLEMKVLVATATQWPMQKSVPLRLPEEMARAAEAYTAMFSAKFGGSRRLQWQPAISSCTLTARLASGATIEVALVSTLQAAVLLLFNQKTDWPWAEMKEELGMPEVDLRRVLASLCKAGLLKEAGDSHVLNTALATNQRRMRVPLPALPAGEVRTETAAAVAANRDYEIDAAIVRLMKSRKRAQQHEIFRETCNQLKGRFQPDMRSIKRRLEQLQEREYVRRLPEDRMSFEYVA